MKLPEVNLSPKLFVGLFIIGGLSFLSLQPIFWPGGLGFEKGHSVTSTTETVQSNQKDKQGNPVKTTHITTSDEGKTLWDWMSLLGVPLTLLILGGYFQHIQQKQAAQVAKEQRELASEDAKEEILQGYFDRLSVLLVDKNLLAISARYVSPTSTIFPHRGSNHYCALISASA